MATATINPPTFTAEQARLHRAWLWMRELARKAAKGFGSSVYKVRNGIVRIANTSVAYTLAAGAQIGLATSAGWDRATRAVSNTLGFVAKRVIQVGRGISWLVDKVGKGLGWVAGLFSKRAGDSITTNNARFTAWRDQRLSSAAARVDGIAFAAHAAMTSRTASVIGRSFAGIVGVSAVANILTKGAVAAKVTASAGAKAAALLGPTGLLATAVVGIVGGLAAWFFRRAEVNARMQEIADENSLTVDMTEDGGVRAKGGKKRVSDLLNDPKAAAEARAAKEAEELLENNAMPRIPLEEITDEMVMESFRSNPVKPGRNNGTEYTDAQIDKRRNQIHLGTVKVTAPAA